ncbi:MAG: tetratricopeptide repeat protein, partial [bacterium]
LEQASKRLEVVNLYDSALQQFNQGNYERAMSDLERLLRIDPNHQEAKNLYTQAKRKLTPLTKDEEEQIRKLFLRGMQFFAKDQYAKAIEEWEKILEIDPTNESVKRNIQEAKDRLSQLEGRE